MTIDLSKFGIVRAAQKRFPNGERFLKGPVPMRWLNAAGCLPGKAVQVAVCIWHLSGLTKSLEVKVTSKYLREMGVTRHAGYRALKVLEGRGLITVERHRGRSPVVTIKNM